MNRRRVFWVAQLGGWGAYGLSSFLTVLPTLDPAERPALLAAKMLRAGTGLLASLILAALFAALRRRGVGAAATVAAAIAACVALGILWLSAYRMEIQPAFAPASAPFSWQDFPRSALDMVFVLLAWSGAYFGAVHWQAYQDQQRDVSEARRLAQEARFRMLAYQLNPHFLFNALNSLRALIGEDRARAREMVTELAAFLRYTLASDPTRLVTVQHEIEAVNSYLSIEAIRFERRLEVVVTLDPAVADCLIPSFLIHPLVENAVKYGSRPLRLEVAVGRAGAAVEIRVANTGRLRSSGSAAEPFAGQESTSTGIGWENIKHRLEHLYPGQYRFAVAEQDGWVAVSVALPASRAPEPVVHA